MRQQTTWDGPFEIRILGRIEARLNGVVVDVGGPRQRRLLAALSMHAGEVVSTDQLIEWTWDDDDRPDGAGQAIRTYVSRMRKALTEAGADGTEILRTEAPGYRLAVRPDQIDAGKFADQVSEAANSAERADSDHGLGLLDHALSLWRGLPYAELAGVSWADAATARLVELRTVAVEERAAARLAQGAHAEVVAELEYQVAEDPLRARPVELLATALFRADRQAEALRVLDRLRRDLVEVGLDLPASVASLESRVAAEDPSLLVTESRRRSQLGGYELAERIGEGAFSLVYRAVQPSVGREVAVKQIRAELANRPEFIRRFEAEAQLVASLEHPFIVPLYDFWREPGAAFLVMRWLRGGTLESRLLDDRLAVDEVVEMVTQVGSALETAHGAGVIHRDVKSANIFLDGAGNYYLGDFGIAVDETSRHDPEALLSAGSPAYASPEQLRREVAGPQSDVYGLGIVLYEALTGHLPFPDEETHAALLHRQLNDALPPIGHSRPDLPPAVDLALRRATAKRADDRHETVTALVDELCAALDGTARPAIPDARRSSSTVIAGGVNPFKGLRAFQEADADEFRGRDRLVDRLLDRMRAEGPEGRFVAAVGPSGSGKSSVVRAGLIPRVRRGALPGSDRWFITTMAPGADPFDELEAALNRISAVPTAGLSEQMRGGPRGIARTVKAVMQDPDAEVLVVVDQLEELFTLVDDESLRHRFLDALLTAVSEPRSQLRVVATIRADFWDRPLRHPELARLLELSAVTVPPMAADELERAIVDPAAGVGAEFEPGLVSVIVADVRDQPGSLPLLQYALTELYDRRVSETMTLQSYRDLGGVAGSLARRAEQLFEDNPADQSGVRRLFTRLVTPGEGTEDTRRRVRRTELDAVSETVLERFGAARLLSFDRDPATREPTVEVAHEALIRSWPRLRQWIDEDRDGLRVARHLTGSAAEWELGGRGQDELYRGARLELARDWAADNDADMTPSERAFLTASTEAHQRDVDAERQRIRRLRTLVGVAAIIALIAGVAGVVAYVQQQRAEDATAEADAARTAAEASAEEADVQRGRAEDARNEAEAERLDSDLRRLAAEAVTLAPIDQDLALLLAVEVAQRWDDPAALGALFDVLAGDTGVITTLPGPAGANDSWVGYLDDRTVVVRASTGVFVYDVERRVLLHEYPAAGQIAALGGVVAADSRGTAFATLLRDDTAFLLPGPDAEPTIVDVGPGALDIAVGGSDTFIVGYETGEIRAFGGPDFGDRIEVGRHPFAITGLAWDAIAGVLVSADFDHNVAMWRFDGTIAEAIWTLTQHAESDWLPDSERGVRLGDERTTRPHGVVAGAPPEPDGGAPLDVTERRVDVDVAADGTGVHVLIDSRILLTLSASDGGQLWSVGGTLTRSGMRALPDGGVLWQDRIVSASGEVRQLDVEPGTRTGLSPDGTVLATHGTEGVALLDLTGARLLATPIERGCADWATLSPDGSLIAALALNDCPTASTDAGLFEVETGDRLELSLPPSWFSFTAEGDFHHTSFDERGRVENFFDPRTQEPVLPPLLPEDLGWGAFVRASDGRVFLGDINDPEVRVYDAARDRTMTLRHPLLTEREAGGVYFVDVNDAASYVAATAQTLTVVWDTSTGEPVATFEAEPDQIMTEVEFISESHLLVVGSQQIEEFDILTGERSVVAVGVVQASGVYNANSLEVTDHGLTVLAGSDGLALHDSETWAPVGTSIPSDFLLFSSSIAAGGDWAVTGSRDHFFVWNLDPAEWPVIACEAAGRNLTPEEWDRYAPTGADYRPTCPEWPPAGA